jgi:hypothetical protein
MIFYGDEYMHIRPVHCGQPMGPILIGPVGPILIGPLQSHQGAAKGPEQQHRKKKKGIRLWCSLMRAASDQTGRCTLSCQIPVSC